jgi:hypothetical protein
VELKAFFLRMIFTCICVFLSFLGGRLQRLQESGVRVGTEKKSMASPR